MIDASWQDQVNGLFECFGGVFIINHIATLYKDKMVRGVSIISTVFFAIWGFWNLYFYPHLGQWASFYGGLVITITNTIWIGMMIYYTNKETKVTIV